MATFSAPKPKPKYQYEIDTLLGADLSNAPNNVDISRSPCCPNMIRDTVGKVRKRHGITLVKTLTGNINGVHFLRGATTKKLVHAGTKLYLNGETELYSTMNDHISVSKQINGKLWILDGANYLVYDGTTVSPVTATATIPVVLIGRAPTGGGIVLEPVNLLQPKRTVKFLGTATDKNYYPPTNIVNPATVTVKKMSSAGVFVDLVNGTDFQISGNNVVVFSSAPGVSPVTGEDNIYITYESASTSDRIQKCDISVLYGINGARDRLFVSGNLDYPNYDWYCQINDPSYFGDINYSVIGTDSSSIVNYSIVNEYLVTHKNNAENDSNAILRKGSLTDNKAVFKLEGSYQTSGALAKHSFAVLENEPLYVTNDKNISAITPSDILGERFSQERSYYITKALEKEANLVNSYACVYERFYALAVGSTIYLLDGSQYSYEKNRPYSTRQFECYYFPNISARVMWVENDELHFGTTDGKIKKFDKNSNNDEGAPIIAYWDTPELDGKSFADKKTFTYVGTRLASAIRTGVQISAKIQGIWELLVPYNNEAQYLDFNDIDFNNFTFSTDTTPHTLGSKIKIKNVDKVQFRFENSRLDEPFGIYKALFEYTEGNKYRK